MTYVPDRHIVTLEFEHTALLEGPGFDLLKNALERAVRDHAGNVNLKVSEYVLEGYEPGVAVLPPDDSPNYTVMGDVNELFDSATTHQIDVYRLGQLDHLDTANYAIVPWVQRTFPGVELDPEASCFYAYTPDEATATKLAEAINKLEWMVPADA